MKYSELLGKDVGYAFDRKEEKDHGEGGAIVGLPPGKTSFDGAGTVIVDDVMTTGGSIIDAVKLVKSYDSVPLGCAIGFDRQECTKEGTLSAVQEFEKRTGLKVVSAANLETLIKVLKAPIPELEPKIPEGILNKILIYRDKYGVK